MWRLIFYVVLLVVAVWLGLWLEQDTGYVLIAYKHWTVETSLWFSVVAVFVIVFLLYYLVKFAGLLIRSHGHLLSWYRQKQFLKAHNLTGAGLLALEEAQWREAESLLLRGAASSSVPVVNFLNAARAAQQRQDYKSRDKYLKRALFLAEGKERFAVYVAKANLLYQQKSYDEALTLLEKLHKEKGRHLQVLNLLQQVYLAKNNYTKLSELLPILKKQKVLDKADYQSLAVLVYSKLLKESDGEIAALKKLWRSLPRALQGEVKVAEIYINRLIDHHEDDEARTLINETMRSAFSPELANAYMRLHDCNLNKRKKKALQWLKHYGENSALLNLLAELALEEQDYLAAKEYAEKVLSNGVNATSLVCLLKACDGLGEQHLADQTKEKLIALSLDQN